MDLAKLQELIRIFEDSGLSEIEIEEEGHRVCLKKSRGEVYTTPTIAVAPPVQPVPVAADQATQPFASAPAANASETSEADGLVTIDSPMVGVFYAAPAPGEPPFVRPGDNISEDQTVCIVEAMKLMNEVTAKFPAVIEKVLVENGEPVEFGQPLFAVRRLDKP